MVEAAKGSKAPIARLADQVDGVFVSVVITIATAAGLGWWIAGYDLPFALSIFIAVLVIAILSMFLTPADPGSMLLMGVPLVGLYFGGILLCRYMPGHAVAKRAETPEESSGS